MALRGLVSSVLRRPLGATIPSPFAAASTAAVSASEPVTTTTTTRSYWQEVVRGTIGGGVAIQELKDLAANTGIDQTVEDLLDAVLGLNADLGPDEMGTCQRISITLEVEAVQAFWYEGA